MTANTLAFDSQNRSGGELTARTGGKNRVSRGSQQPSPISAQRLPDSILDGLPLTSS